MIKEIDLLGDEQTLKYIGERISLLETARDMEQNDMPKCTNEELWASGETWAIMMKGGKRAIKVYKEEEKAKEHEMKPGYEIIHRPGKVARCRYCNARKFCNQYQELIEEGRSENYER